MNTQKKIIKSTNIYREISGFSLVELVISLAVMVITVLMFIAWQSNLNKSNRNRLMQASWMHLTSALSDYLEKGQACTCSLAGHPFKGSLDLDIGQVLTVGLDPSVKPFLRKETLFENMLYIKDIILERPQTSMLNLNVYPPSDLPLASAFTFIRVVTLAKMPPSPIPTKLPDTDPRIYKIARIPVKITILSTNKTIVTCTGINQSVKIRIASPQDSSCLNFPIPTPTFGPFTPASTP
jgi:type II secretory pathway pseudopilin PulG